MRCSKACALERILCFLRISRFFIDLFRKGSDLLLRKRPNALT
jgi:hypothetical protein